MSYTVCVFKGLTEGLKTTLIFQSIYEYCLFICFYYQYHFLAFCNVSYRTEHALVLTSCVDSHSFPFAAVEMKSIRFIGHFLQK